MKNSMGKRIFAILLVIMMVFCSDLKNAELIYAAVQNAGDITLQNNEEGNNAQVEDNRVSSPENIELNLGTQYIKSSTNSTYAFLDATITGENIRSLVVYFTEAAEGADSIILPSSTAITLVNGTNDYKIISIAEGTTTDVIQAYIRDITFTIGGSEKEVLIMASKSVVTRNTYFNYRNRHFYQYVSDATNWIPAYNAAKASTFAGRQGYLVTLTSADEEAFVVSTFVKPGWIGGTRMVLTSDGIFDEKKTISEVAVVDKNGWYWLCGPEKDTCFYRQAASNAKPLSAYSGFFSELIYELDCLQTFYNGFLFNTYSNWSLDGWSKDTQPKLLSYTEVGNCVYMKLDGGSETGAYWFSEYGHAKECGYFIEYGDKTVGDSLEGTKSAHTATIKKMTQEATPYIDIDFLAEELKGFDPAKTYLVNGIELDPTVYADGTLAIDEEWYGEDICVEVKGDGKYTAKSEEFRIEIPHRAGTPVGVDGSNRSLTGLSTDMEYRKEGAVEWKKVTSTKIQRLEEGWYEIRVTATNTSFKSHVARIQVTAGGASISVNVNKKMDVALAVGSTGVDYSNFEKHLKDFIENHPVYSVIDLEDLNLMATNAIDTSGQNSFDWLKFDHSANASIYNNSSNPFIEDVGKQTGNLYNDKDYHIESTDTPEGAKLTFYGYGSSPYADFMLLENDMETKKSFQFAIKEYFAADALFGTGFFFNCNMVYTGYNNKEAAYDNSKLSMDGYLVVLEYDEKSATQLVIYYFKGLNLKNFHNTSSQKSVSAALEAAATSVDTLATLAVDDANGPLKSTDDLRKFRIEVSPTKVDVYYVGFDDGHHYVEQTENETYVYGTSSELLSKYDECDDYKAFTNMTYDENGLFNSSHLVLSATLPERFGGSDFGPMAKYGSHNCARLTKVELSELSMTMEVVRSLSETLREPKWSENTDKFLINLNENPINDFDDVAITAELLNRLQNDDIYYIGWCGDKNAIKSQQFLQKNNLKGGIININHPDYNDYSEQIAAIAKLIYNRYSSSAKTKDVVTLEQEKEILISNAETVNTADADFPEGKWRIDYYSDFDATQLVSSVYQSDFECDLDKVGVYKFYYAYMDGDDPIKTITVHTTPQASITSAIDKDNKKAVFFANVMDSDNNSNKPFTYLWTYKDLKAAPTDDVNVLGTTEQVELTGLKDGDVYIVTLTVTDQFDAQVVISKQITFNENAPTVVIPPTAFFSLSHTTVVTNGSDVIIDVIDNSYDPAGATITNKTYNLYNAKGELVTKNVTVSANGKYTIPSTMNSGEYALGLTVTSANGTSTEMKRFFTVVNDTEAPTVNADIEIGVLPLETSKVKFTFNDEGGSGFYEYRYCVTNSAETPSKNSWSNWSQVPVRNIDFPMQNGSYYVHFQLKDNAGNVATVYKGAYIRNQILSTPENLQMVGSGTPILTWVGDERINGTNRGSYTLVIYKNGAWFTEVSGITTNSYIAANIVRGGNATYTFTVQALADGNTASTEDVSLFDGAVSALSAEFTYVIPELPVVSGGEIDFSAPLTQEDIDKVFNGFATLDSTNPVKITLNHDVKLEQPIIIDSDVTLNLNENDIMGPDGTKDEPNGQPAIMVDGNNVDLKLEGAGKISGGTGYSGELAGNGGNAIDFGNTTNGTIEIPKDISIFGGAGGDSTEGVGGNGGCGIAGSDLDVSTKGDIIGGNGGSGATVGGAGGTGIANGSGDIDLAGDAIVGGGCGGDGPVGGNGGAAIEKNGGITEIGSDASVIGGNGGEGSTGAGGNGGNAINANNQSVVNNTGIVMGGSGGNSQNAAGGAGGNAFDGTNSTFNNIDGTLISGNGGRGETPGAVGAIKDEVTYSPGGVLEGLVEINNQMTEQAAKAAAESNQQKIDAVFGEGNAIYNPATNTIVLVKDVHLEDSIQLSDDIKIDLNGNSLNGPNGTKENPDGKPAISVQDEDISIEVTNSNPQRGGAIVGGSGYDGTEPGVAGGLGEAGGNGGNAIDFGSNKPGYISLGNGADVKGGEGGDSKYGEAGNGGSAITGDEVEITVDNATAAGGNGGNGGLVGGNGGNAVDAGSGNVTVNNGDVTGGNGGSGDIGGNGGTAIAVDGNGNAGSGEVTIAGSQSNITGGNAGSSVNGTPGNAGNALDIKDGNATVIPDANGKPAISGGKDANGKVTETTEEELIGIQTAPGGRLTDPLSQSAVDAVFGKGNAIYDKESDTIIIQKDIVLEDTVEVATDVTIDINGHTIVGPSGTESQPDAPSVFEIVEDDVKLGFNNSKDGGAIIGGAGFDGTIGTGGNGGAVVDFGDTTGSELIIGENTSIVGGNGGDSVSSNGGAGGSAVIADNGKVTNNGYIAGGNGGYSTYGDGGNGGSAIVGENTIIVSNGTAASGNGGNSANGNGGNGGIIFDGENQNISIQGPIQFGEGGESLKDGNGTNGSAGAVSSNPSGTIYEIVDDSDDKIYFEEDNAIVPGEEFTGTIKPIDELIGNDYVSLPEKIDVFVNGEKLSEDKYTYNKETGEVTIPGEYVTGSVAIKASSITTDKVEVTTEEEFIEALKAGVTTVIVAGDITVSQDCVVKAETTLIIKEGASLNLGENSLVVNGKLEADGAILAEGNGGIVPGEGAENGIIYTPILPEKDDKVEVISKGNNGTVNHGGAYTFEVVIGEGYSKTEDFKVFVNGVEVELSEDNTYTIEQVQGQIEIEVVGIADITAPSGQIIYNEEMSWAGWLADLIFNQTFVKPDYSVEIQAQDAGTGVAYIEYAVVDKEMSMEELRAYKEWKTYAEAFAIKGKDKDNLVIYVKLVDNVNNICYINTEGLTIIDIAPEIGRTEDYGVYEEEHTIVIDPVTTDKVTINGVETTFDEEGNVNITEPGVHKIVVTDKVGNVTEYDIRVLGENETNGLKEEAVNKEETYIFGIGDITLVVENATNALKEVVVDNAKNVIEAILDEEHFDSISKGDNYDVKIVVDEDDDKVSKDDIEIIENALVENEEYEELESILYMDIKVMYTEDGDSWEVVSETSKVLRFTYIIPEEFLENAAEFYVARCHNGEVELLEDLDDVPNTITFESSLYSTYSLVRIPQVKSYEKAAQEWLDAFKDILSADKVTNADKVVIDAALEAFELLPEKAKELLVAEKNDLENKKVIADKGVIPPVTGDTNHNLAFLMLLLFGCFLCMLALAYDEKKRKF